MLRQYIIDPVHEIWQTQILPGMQGLGESALFWKLIVLLIVVIFLYKALRKKIPE